MVRFKNRYFAVEVNPTGKQQKAPFYLNSYALQASILKKVEQLHGDFGIAAVQAGFTAKYCNKWTRIAMIRTRHGPHRLVASTLPMMNDVSGHQITLHTLYVGATLQQCYRFVRRYQQRQLIKIWSVLKTDEERHAMETAVMDLKPLESFISPQHPGKKSS
ncbi:ribonuclease P/MRP protein subunit POP5 [Schistocerca piceifrons]|uniref:ribonuclease P/MRP protein subunit POP5 n=1 Tax=Schistocerca piceifrons TaxID=274613 RepID=UPI001F5FBE87|nr:ribonuclease P/MRP protein subunit POP5 [Schistocerca piceifrons]XP_049814815.1 ribonuclease P/MRP protein subunit POP5 [Schistocerca nitens]XP_049859383.1 ribonuclease P/MRP protein subunit POP5 [Schistocerca gregaria]XP_049958050.1 ribonuclease P/MRP protein subunit POP5 isoform X1 [Schistocerca serialis cubense]